jgi:hypothetical protein
MRDYMLSKNSIIGENHAKFDSTIIYSSKLPTEGIESNLFSTMQ